MKGAYHHWVTGMMVFPIAMVCQRITGDPIITISSAMGCLTGLVIHPDLDQCEANCHGLNKTVFWLYGKLFHHRGISHFPILGTLTRLIYLGLPLSIVWLLLGCPTIPEVVIKAAAWAALGLSLSDLGHCILDLKI